MDSSIYEFSRGCKTEIYVDYITASLVAANRIKELVKENGRLTIGVVAGSSPIAVYSELIRAHREDGISFTGVQFFLIDEYYPLNRDARQSKRSELVDKLIGKLDVSFDNFHSLSSSAKDYTKECGEYEEKIKDAGGFDFILMGIGGTGHIGANEPGTLFNSRTRLVPLDSVTRISAASNFKGEEFVPNSALTMGLGTIMESKELLVLAFGEGKSSLVKSINEGEVTNLLPASIIKLHPNSRMVIDKGAASQLLEVRSPWLKSICHWNDSKLIRKAVIWLSEHLNKSILKLTNRDYMDNGMGDLINVYGSAYSVNIKIFNEIEKTITGWPGGKADVSDENRPERALPNKKRVLVFSPHPDDDVISMGGTLARLVSHNHDVHVAYQTDGNLGVGDDKIQEVLDLLSELDNPRCNILQVNSNIIAEIQNFLDKRDPLLADTSLVQLIKGLIRKVETISACRYVGIPLENNHHLNLPFYNTGEVRKKPLSQDDINIVKNILEDIKPHQIFAAGDLADPHGTHRVCLDAIFRALEELVVEKTTWLNDCRVWLYRGAWAEWPIDEVSMAVPISPEELMKKRISIYKHASQKDGVIFPGSDLREFWQRAEDRNRGTADTYNRLGFAEYEAIELFVRYYFDRV